MNNELTHKEEALRDYADRLSFDIDTDSLWQSIEPELPPTKEKRRPGWWIWAGVLGGILAVGIYILSHTNNATQDDGTANRIAQQVDVQGDPFSPEKHKQKTTKTSTTVADHTAPAQETEDSVEPATDTNTTSSKISDRASISTPRHGTPQVSQRTSLDHIDDNQTLEITASHPSDHEKQHPIVLVPPIQKENNTDPALPRLALDDARLLPMQSALPISAHTRILAVPSIEIIQKPKAESFYRWAIGTHATQERITTNSPEIKTEANREQALLGFNAHLTYGLAYTSGWHWAVGLQYKKNITRYMNRDRSVSQTSTTGTTQIRIDGSGNQTQTQGDIIITTITQNDILWHRSHDFIDLQGSVGKTIYSIGSLSIGSDVYVGYNVLSRHTGYYLPESGASSIEKFEAGDPHVYGNQGLTIAARLPISYALGRIDLQVSPYLERGLGAITQPSNAYQIKNSQYGVQLGIVYRPYGRD